MAQELISSSSTSAELWADIKELTYKIGEIYKEDFASEIPSALLQLSHFYNICNEIVASTKQNQSALVKAQEAFLQDFFSILTESLHKGYGEDKANALEVDLEEPEGDKRFVHTIWHDNPYFDFLRKSYYLLTKHSLHWYDNLFMPDSNAKNQFHLYIKNVLNLLAPTNFMATNPEVAQETLQSGGLNLLKGYRNFLEDLLENKGHLNIRNTDLNAFKVGENLAITPGKIIYQNEIMQLIQYLPSTAEVYQTPILFVPPCINKYYVLDLQPENSLVKYLVDSGFTVYMISWVNPGSELAHKEFSDYMLEGPLQALEIITQTSGCKTVHLTGYCIGGTLLACSLAYMKAKNDPRAASATYFMTLMDFYDPGELGVFIEKRQLEVLDKIMRERGYLDGRLLELAFNVLRPNELIWPYFINNYLLGKTPRAFDLLYWNTDSTNQPYKMYQFYLENMYLHNRLTEENGIQLNGIPINLKTITTPSFFLSSETDHISLWRSVYAGTLLQSGPIEFVLSGSGHVAGVINPPWKMKHGYKVYERTSATDKIPRDPDRWLKKAKEYPGSWWPYWVKWLVDQDAKKIPARDPIKAGIPIIEDAPGSYVLKRI